MGTFRYRNGQSTQELVYRGTYGGWFEYRERNEASFSRYLQQGNVWRILRPDGQIIDLGNTTNSTQGTDTASFAGTARWYVTQIADPHTNYVKYNYRSPGLIDSIQYNGNATTAIAPGLKVQFVWSQSSTSPDGLTRSYRRGFLQLFGQNQLTEISVIAPVHATGTSPAQIPPTSPTTRNYLFDHQVTGTYDSIYYLTSARIENEPATVFAYQNTWTGPTIDGFTSVSYSGSYDLGFPATLGFTQIVPAHDSIGSYSISRTSTLLADLTSDGRPDLILSLTTGGFLVWRNNGTGFGARETWAAPTAATGVPLPEAGSLRTVTSRASVEADTVQDFFDLNGDGFPDLVYVVQGSQLTLAYCPGTGTGFGQCVLYNTGGYIPIPTNGPYIRRDEIAASNVNATDVDFIDMNGDGRPDAVLSQPGTGGLANLIIRFNIGNGFSLDTTTVTRPACTFPGFPGCIRLAQSDNTSSGRRVLLSETRDINGDGLPDFLTQDLNTGTIWGAYNLGFFPAPGTTGTGYTALTQLTNSATYTLVNGPGTIGAGYLNAAGINNSPPGEYTAINELIDMNGDGLVDIVSYDCKVSPLSVTIRFNNGGVWDSGSRTYSLSTVFGAYATPCLADVLNYDYRDQLLNWTETRSYINSMLIDFNGDGIPDFLSGYTGQQNGTQFSWMLRQLTYLAPRKLSTALSLGGNNTVTITYAPQNGTAPYPIHAPITVTRARTPLYTNEPSRNWMSTVGYSYTAPTFDRTLRQFTGFGTVVATGDAFATDTTTNYGTGIALAGLTLDRTIVNKQAAGASLMKRNTYSIVSEAGGGTWARLDKAENLPGISRDLIVDYVSYDTYGRPTSWIERGDLGTTDDISRQRTYVTRDQNSASAPILDLVSTETASSVANGHDSTTRYYYDGLALGATPTNGDLTKLEREKIAGSYVSTTQAIDTNGNITSATNEIGIVSTYTYDATYRLYRVSTTTPVGTTYNSYHVLTGQVADSCGPKYSGASWHCRRTEVDAMGRTTAVYVPTLSGAVYGKALLATYAYNDTSYPFTTSAVLRGTSRAFQYRDGFGNATQLRTEETANVFRVYETAFDAFGYPQRMELPRRENGVSFTHSPVSSEAWLYSHDYVRGAIERITEPRDSGDQSPAAFSTRVVTPSSVIAHDQDNRESDYLIDGFGRVYEVDEQGGALGIARTTLAYSDQGEVTAVTDANNLRTSYGRNLLGWVQGVTTPDLKKATYSQDDRGAVTSATDARGVNITYKYDVAGRLTSVLTSKEPVGVRNVNATISYYDSSTSSLQIGEIRTETSDGITQTFTYTPEGNVATRRADFGTHGGAVTFGYAIGQRLDTVQYPDGVIASYLHNLDDSVSEVRDGGGRRLATYLYQDDGKPSVVTNQFGLDEAWQYDARGRGVGRSSTNDIVTGGALVDDRLVLSKASYVTQLSRYGLGPNLTVRTSPDVYTMSNDALGRLTQVDKNATSFAHYSYDLAGRLVGMNEAGGSVGTAVFSYDQLTSRTTGATVQSWTYDTSGNVTHDETRVSGTLTRGRDHSWDGFGRYIGTKINGGKSSTYYYTPRGEVARVVSPTALPSTADVLNIGDSCRLDMSSNTWTDRVYANDEVVVEIKGARIEMPHRTFGGSVAAVSNDLGQVIRQEEFKPYGTPSAGNPSGTYEEHFQGLRADELLVAGGRAYDSDGAIWFARDSFALANPQSIALVSRRSQVYTFDFSNPYRFRDPLGTDPVTPPPDPWDTADCDAQCKFIRETMERLPDDLPKGRAVVIDGSRETWSRAKANGVPGVIGVAMFCPTCARAIAVLAMTQAKNEGEALCAAVGGFLSGLIGGTRGASLTRAAKVLADGAGQNIALGLGEGLEDFAARIGGSTWKQWAAENPLNWKSSFVDVVGNPANRVNFNLSGVDSAWAAASRASRGAGGATDWELLQIQQNPGWWSRITFWNNGQTVPNPFE